MKFQYANLIFMYFRINRFNLNEMWLTASKHSWTSNALWAGALSWRKHHEIFHHKEVSSDYLSDCDLATVHNHFFHILHVFIGCWCTGTSRVLVIFDVFVWTLIQLINHFLLIAHAPKVIFNIYKILAVPPGPSSIENDAHGIEKLLLKLK